MHPKKQNNSITKAKNSDLRTLLKTDDSRALVRYVGSLRASELQKIQSEGADLMLAITHFRERYMSLKTIIATSEGEQKADAEKDLRYVERKGMELRAQYDAMNVQPTLTAIAADNEDELIKDLALLLLDLDESFNINKGLSVPQIEHLSTSIPQRYGSLTLDDIALCFHQAKCGDYGQVYDRLDLNVIYGWLNQYLNDRKTLIAAAQQNRHLSHKHGMSYDPADKASTVNASRERGINTDDETHFQAFKADLLQKSKK